MLESNWVRVCELEERSLNVSHCCRRQTVRKKKQQTCQSAGNSDITLLLKNPRVWAQLSRLNYHYGPKEGGRGAELAIIMSNDEEEEMES